VLEHQGRITATRLTIRPERIIAFAPRHFTARAAAGSLKFSEDIEDLLPPGERQANLLRVSASPIRLRLSDVPRPDRQPFKAIGELRDEPVRVRRVLTKGVGYTCKRASDFRLEDPWHAFRDFAEAVKVIPGVNVLYTVPAPTQLICNQVNGHHITQIA
jgi:hypothetical protein